MVKIHFQCRNYISSRVIYVLWSAIIQFGFLKPIPPYRINTVFNLYRVRYYYRTLYVVCFLNQINTHFRYQSTSGNNQIHNIYIRP